jgi:hypothetical protein
MGFMRKKTAKSEGNSTRKLARIDKSIPDWSKMEHISLFVIAEKLSSIKWLKKRF